MRPKTSVESYIQCVHIRPMRRLSQVSLKFRGIKLYVRIRASSEVMQFSLVGSINILEELAISVFGEESNLHVHRDKNLKSHEIFEDRLPQPTPSPAVHIGLLGLSEMFQNLNITCLHRFKRLPCKHLFLYLTFNVKI